MNKQRNELIAKHQVIVREQPQALNDSVAQYFLRAGDFDPANNNEPPNGGKPQRRRKKAGQPEPYLLVGFDTEYKTPGILFTPAEIKSGAAKYTVLSYQFHCRASSGETWSGIHCPVDGERMDLSEFLTFALAKGTNSGAISKLPSRIYLVGHFTRADIPAFADFKNLQSMIGAVRNTFISMDGYLPLRIKFPDAAEAALKVVLRDTMLLTAAGAKSLAAIGEIIGRPKIKLSDSADEELHLKRNMDELLSTNWPLFAQYALNDAVICAEYARSLMDLYHQNTGKYGLPPTLTSIGLEILWQNWEENGDPLDILGQERVDDPFFDAKKGRMVPNRRIVPLREIHWQLPFVTETYHGGRNEQFWFGPSYPAAWTDYDLAGAYPTAMALIGKPRWHEMDRSPSLEDFGPTTLGFACVEFEFPESVRYPTLPVRTPHGLLFPRRGESCCASPEVWLAKQLGANLTLKHGLIVPCDDDDKVFSSFVAHCIHERKQYDKKSLKELFWKELVNSTYGKLAQGLMRRRIYDMRDRATRPLPPSRITNPFFASYTTSYVRATLGEIMNSIPKDTMVFSCTTDGFLTDASDVAMLAAQSGVLATAYRTSRMSVSGENKVLEIKHRVRRLLGWKTRGQATLEHGDNIEASDANIVLAKSSIYTEGALDTTDLQNDYIVRLFFDRKPEQELIVHSVMGLRDIVERDNDLVEKIHTRRLNMEYDFKRRPHGVGASPDYGKHVLFSTSPWDTFEQFRDFREMLVVYQKDHPVCIKTIEDLHRLLDFAAIRLSVAPTNRAYLRKTAKEPDIARLRIAICSAWKHSKAGFQTSDKTISATQFANILSMRGIPCKRSHVEYGRRKLFVPNSCPRTNRAAAALAALRKRFPSLDETAFFAPTESSLSFQTVGGAECPFVALAEGPPKTPQ